MISTIYKCDSEIPGSENALLHLGLLDNLNLLRNLTIPHPYCEASLILFSTVSRTFLGTPSSLPDAKLYQRNDIGDVSVEVGRLSSTIVAQSCLPNQIYETEENQNAFPFS